MTANNETAVSAQANYAAALRAFAAGPLPSPSPNALGEGFREGLTAEAIAALYPLNAVFYLRDYLPAREYAAAVATAARGLGDYDAAAPHIAAVTKAPHSAALIRLAGTRADATSAVIMLQHVLEIEPSLDRPAGRSIRAAMRDLLLALPEAPERIAWAGTAARGGLSGWALCNARPPRAGEIAAWAGCLGRRPPLEQAQQALAGGLRFDVLLDALAVAAALRLHARPAEHEAAGLIAAHAVRRLTAIAAAPALNAWLGVTAALTPPPGRALLKRHELAPEPQSLALAAVCSGEPLLIQTAEAALMEGEALPPELRHAPLDALAALLLARGRLEAVGAPRQANKEHAASTAAAGGTR